MRKTAKAPLSHSDKIKAGIRKARKIGKGRSGNPVLVSGLDDGGTLRNAIENGKKRKADEFAAKHRVTIEKMKDAGATLQMIADHLNGQNIPTARNKAWTPTTVRNLLLRPPSSIDTALSEIRRSAPWRIAGT